MNIQPLTNSQRANRVTLGGVMILFTMFINATPLGLLATLPLLATYPIFAGIYGYDPVKHLMSTSANNLKTAVIAAYHKHISPGHGSHHF